MADLTTIPGETLAEILVKQFEIVTQAQNNLLAIKEELRRRKQTQGPLEKKTDGRESNPK